MIQNQLNLDPLGFDVRTRLDVATIRPARANGWDNEIGSLAAGKRAEIAVFDLDTFGPPVIAG